MGERFWFGLKPPAQATVAWGARAIIGGKYAAGRQISYVHDRIQFANYDEEFQQANRELATWIDQDVWPLLQRALSVSLFALDGSSSDVLAHDEGDFHFRCSPNSSHGYLYMCAWAGDNESAEYWNGDREYEWVGSAVYQVESTLEVYER